MTTPGGVPNLPKDALTLQNLASRVQDMSGQAMRARAANRFPTVFNAAPGGNPALDISPMGILTGIWATVNSTIANADPADIQGPDDLPPLFVKFIADLPIQTVAWVRTSLERLASVLGLDMDGLLDDGFDTADAIGALVENIIDAVIDKFEELTGIDLTWLHSLFEGLSETGSIVEQFYDAITGRGPTGGFQDVRDWFHDVRKVLGNPLNLGTGNPIIGPLSSIPLLGQFFGGVGAGTTLLGSLLPILDGSMIQSGIVSLANLPSTLLTTASSIAAAALTGLINVARIPLIDGSKIGSGKIDLDFLPNVLLTTASSIAASLLTGVLNPARIPLLDGTVIGSGKVSLDFLPNILLTTASSIAAGAITGLLSAARIPLLDASKIDPNGGKFAPALVSGLVGAFGSLFSMQTQRENLVVDGSFEDESQWPNTIGTQTTARVHGGTYSRRVVTNGASNQDVFLHRDHRNLPANDINGMWKVQKDQTPYFEVWFYALGSNTFNQGTTPALSVAFRDSTGVLPDVAYPVYRQTWSELYASRNTWVKYSGHYPCPPGYDRYYAYCRIYGNDAVGNDGIGNVYYWDDALVRDATEAQDIVKKLSGTVGSIGATILASVLPMIDASKVNSGQMSRDRITNLASDLNARVLKAGDDGFQTLVDRIATLFKSETPISNASVATLFSRGQDFTAALAQGPGSLANIDRNQTENTQVKQIMAGQIVTPINSLITTVRDRFNSLF